MWASFCTLAHRSSRFYLWHWSELARSTNDCRPQVKRSLHVSILHPPFAFQKYCGAGCTQGSKCANFAHFGGNYYLTLMAKRCLSEVNFPTVLWVISPQLCASAFNYNFAIYSKLRVQKPGYLIHTPSAWANMFPICDEGIIVQLFQIL